MALNWPLLALLLAAVSGTVVPADTKKPLQGKKPKMTILFEVQFGEAPGQFHFEPSPLGPELDIYPRDFVRDAAGNFLFLEPAPAARLTSYSASGKLLWTAPLVDHLPDSIGEGEISPQQVFVTQDGAAVLLGVAGTAGAPMKSYLAYFDDAGSLRNLVPLRDFDPKYFDEGGASELDQSGHLLVMRRGGITVDYGPDGSQQHAIEELVSYADPSGLLFAVGEPLTMLSPGGGDRKELTIEDGEAPRQIDGGNGHGLIWTVRLEEEQTPGNLLIDPWFMKVFSFSPVTATARFLRELELPANTFRSLGPDEPVIRERVYGPKIVMDEKGGVYILGRSEKKVWVVKIEAA